MVEVSHFTPLHGGVTCFAASHRAVRPLGFHLHAEFTMVGVVVANRTGPVVKPVFHWSYGTLQYSLMAISAWDSDVGARQRETRVFMLGQGKNSRPETFVLKVMTCFAAIQGRCRGELTFVNVFVAIPALRRCNLELGVLAFGAFGDVTLVARDRDVDAFQGVFGIGVFLHAKRGGLPILLIVATRAFAVIGAGVELSMMCVLVAIHALGVRYGRLEIAFCVAFGALNGFMLSK